MAGGFGSRFWPICRDENPKQFSNIMGGEESMLQTTFHRFERICPRENIIIVTHQRYVGKVREQIPDLDDYQVLSEPHRRNTAPCIAYAAAVIKNRCPDANIIVTPADHAIFHEAKFQNDINQALSITSQQPVIVTLGVPPTDPNTSYGYIQINDAENTFGHANMHKVITFTEKPPLEIAKQFIATGEFFWNAGIFVWSLPTLIKSFKKFLPTIYQSFLNGNNFTPTEEELSEIYAQTGSISVDVGIMEHATNVHVLQASFGWSDIESWESLYANAPKQGNQNCIISGQTFTYEVSNTLVNVPANKKVILQGLDGYIVAGTEDTILVCRRNQEDSIFKFSLDVSFEEQAKTENKK